MTPEEQRIAIARGQGPGVIAIPGMSPKFSVSQVIKIRAGTEYEQTGIVVQMKYIDHDILDIHEWLYDILLEAGGGATSAYEGNIIAA